MLTLLAGITFTLGAFVCLLNLYLSFLRYPLHLALKKPKERFVWVSGYPLVGSLLVGLSLLQLNRVPALLWIAAALILIDTGGIHWFVGTLIYRRLKKDAKQ